MTCFAGSGRRYAGSSSTRPTHPIVLRNLEGLAEALRSMHTHDATVVIGMLGDEVIVGDMPMTKASISMGELIRRFASLGIERITISRGVTSTS